MSPATSSVLLLTATGWPCNWGHIYSWTTTKKLHHCPTSTSLIIYKKIWGHQPCGNALASACVQIIYIILSLHQSVVHSGWQPVMRITLLFHCLRSSYEQATPSRPSVGHSSHLLTYVCPYNISTNNMPGFLVMPDLYQI